MVGGEALVAEIAVDFVDALEAAHHQALQVKLGRDAQVEVDIERVVMGHEGARGGAAVERLHHGGFDFDEAAGLELAAQRADDPRARDEDLAHLGIGDEVEIALAVADFDVLQAVPLFGHGEQGLGEELELLRVDAQLAGAGAEEIALDADDVADIEQLEELEIALAHGVLLDVDLQALSVLLQVGEAGLAHVAQRHEAAGDADAHLGQKLFRGLAAVAGDDLRNGVR